MPTTLSALRDSATRLLRHLRIVMELSRATGPVLGPLVQRRWCGTADPATVARQHLDAIRAELAHTDADEGAWVAFATAQPARRIYIGSGVGASVHQAVYDLARKMPRGVPELSAAEWAEVWPSVQRMLADVPMPRDWGAVKGELQAEYAEAQAAHAQSGSDEAKGAKATGNESSRSAAETPTTTGRKPRRSTERGGAQEKLIAALTKHHRYADGGCLNTEPIGNNDLARLAGVSTGAASKFFNRQFSGHEKYRALCLDTARLVAAMKMLNGDFAPHHLYGATPSGSRTDDD